MKTLCWIVGCIMIFASATGFGQGLVWLSTTELPQRISAGWAFSYGDKVYVLGGVGWASLDGAVNGAVRYAQVATDGSLAPWVSTNPITADLYGFGGAFDAASQIVYVVGGVTHGSPLTGAIYARVNPDGTIGPWQSTQDLPRGMTGQGSVLASGYLYQLGSYSYDGTTYDWVYSAPVNADGTLGVWQENRNLPERVAFSYCVAVNDYVYVIGGLVSGVGRTPSVYFSKANSDGTLGEWQAGPNLPVAVSNCRGFVWDNAIYVGGGETDEPGVISGVFRAEVHPDGTLGAWAPAGQLPAALSEFMMTTSATHVYLLGGMHRPSIYHREVYYASLPVSQENKKVYICHKGNTICVSVNAVEAHLAHGDYLGQCGTGKVFVDIPTDVSLSDAYPNPFNPTTTIEFGIPNDSYVRLEVYNMLGEQVATLVNETRSAGYYAERFEAANLASGLYVYRLQAGDFVQTKKLMLVR